MNFNKGLSIKPHRVQFVLNPDFNSEIPYQHVVYTRFVFFFSVSMLAASMCARAGSDRGAGTDRVLTVLLANIINLTEIVRSGLS